MDIWVIALKLCNFEFFLKFCNKIELPDNLGTELEEYIMVTEYLNDKVSKRLYAAVHEVENLQGQQSSKLSSAGLYIESLLTDVLTIFCLLWVW